MSRRLHAQIRARWKLLKAAGASETGVVFDFADFAVIGDENSRRRSGDTPTGHSHTAWAHNDVAPTVGL